MATQVHIITAPQVKPIEFISAVQTDKISTEVYCKPNEYHHIELICKDYSDGLDLMFAYYEGRRESTGVLYFGHFNDGFVE